jgi:hypothetical protein
MTEASVQTGSPVTVSFVLGLVAEVSLKNMSVDEKKKYVCETAEAALQKHAANLPAEEVSGLTYVIKNVLPQLVDLVNTFNVNAVEQKVEKVVSGYWASCMSCVPVLFRSQVSAVAAEAVKKVEAVAPSIVADAVKKVEAVAPSVVEAVKKVEAVAAPLVKKAEDVVEAVVDEAVKKVEDLASAVPDWSAAAPAPVAADAPPAPAVVDLSGSTAPSNPV